MRLSTNTSLLITLIIFLSYISVEALQCYECTNCLEDEELTELQICGELPTPVRPTTKRPLPTTTTDNSTKKPSNPNDNDDTGEISDESSAEGFTNTTLRPGNIRTTTTRRVSTTRRTTPSDSDEDSDSDWDDDDDERRRAVNKLPKAEDAVCYMVKLSLNATTITRRGCTSMVKGSNVLTCESLNRGPDPLLDCQLCVTNGCNKFATDDWDAEALWNGAERQITAKTWWLFVSLLLSVLYDFFV